MKITIEMIEAGEAHCETASKSSDMRAALEAALSAVSLDDMPGLLATAKASDGRA